ncbi:aminoglycoside phosphotransferase family protein [Actinomadura sp. ATCC 31491]|uniref:Aminoglycoside phosphotransferase family protein n=1 Tax=Actinomadura luzonensis TaxID=2805427 RepID=A0ABT0G531_9ACTN|nr:phosphotransferase [Actinomadura luzonensis]MCK2219682.1 aminoglycoside phosphotransferase family protein [Actinomadura luzonensis]
MTRLVQREIGNVIKAETVGGGIMPGLAARLDVEDGPPVFLKAIDRGSPAAGLHLRERWAGRSLPGDTPAPRLIWFGTVAQWHVMAMEWIDHARHADLTPGSPDVLPVIDTIATLGAVLTPCPSGAMPISENVGPLLAKGRHLLAKPEDLPDRDRFEAALDRLDPNTLRGNTLVHYDLSSTNMLVTAEGEVRVVDWSFAARGAAWLDAAMIAPRLVQAGHSPEAADLLLSTLPNWHAAPRTALVGLAAGWTLFRLYKARYGPEEVREARAEAAEAGRAWMEYQLDKG